jgi:hypothetical protein
MKKVKYTYTGGFPIKQKTLSNMQIAYLDILKAMIGHLGLLSTGSYIIYGLEIAGNQITPGMTYIDGDLCYFEGATGSLTTKIGKIVTIEDAPFKNGNNNPVYEDYRASVNSNGLALSDFERIPPVQELVNVAIDFEDLLNVPDFIVDPNVNSQSVIDRIALLEKKTAVFTVGGGMIFWNKPANQIPAGFREVVNWKGRFPVGVDDTTDNGGNYINPEFSPIGSQAAPGRTGGKKDHNITKNQLPAVSPGNVPLMNQDLTNDGPTNGFGSNGPNYGALPNLGNGEAMPILNPYRTVLFIEWFES